MKLAIIGCGYWGPNYVRIFNELPNTSVKYAVDLSEEKLAKIREKFPSVKTTGNLEEVLGDEEVEAVVVATPASTHFGLVKKCLDAGKNVLAEKPLTMNSMEASELGAIARDRRKILMVGNTFEYNKAVMKLKEYVEKKETGEIYYIYCSRTGLGPIRKDADVIWDLVAHDVSILMYLLRETPKSVNARGSDYLQNGLNDVVFATLEFPDKVIANIHASWLDPQKIRKVTIVGSKKMLVFDDTKPTGKITLFNKRAEKHEYGSFGEFQVLVQSEGEVVPELAPFEPLKDECAEFVSCVEERRNPRTDAEESAQIIRVLEAMERSIRNNGREEVIE
ncbi:MAG: Gfo/Idh/MocA family oxidoreductase [Candidatus Micrarchaeota archaeon]